MSEVDRTGGLPLGPGVGVIHRGAVLALDKPAGLKVHPNRSGRVERALVRAPYDFEREAYVLEDGGFLYLCNRLDSPTSGVVLLARTEEQAQALKTRFARRQVEKTYLAVLKGGPAEGKHTWKDVLRREKREGRLRVRVLPERRPNAGGMLAETRVEAVAGLDAGGDRLSLVRLQPVTGRTHQLRAQAAAHGHPILGDKTYGDFALNKRVAKHFGPRRLMLHACEVRFRYDEGGRAAIFHARSPLPGSWRKAFGIDDA